MSCRTQEEVLRLRDLKVAPHFYGKTFFCFKGEMHAVGRGKPKPLNQLPGPLRAQLDTQPYNRTHHYTQKNIRLCETPRFSCLLSFFSPFMVCRSKQRVKAVLHFEQSFPSREAATAEHHHRGSCRYWRIKGLSVFPS